MANTNQNEAIETPPFILPVRMAWLGGVEVIAGTPGSAGDAGGSWLYCLDRAEALRIMADYPQARVPAWSRIEAGL